MSYTNETTHYAIPKPLGTDLTVPMDYNDAADAIDQALFDASTNATEAVTAANNAVEAAADAVEEVGSLGTEVNNLKGRTSALETSDVIQNNKIDALENQGATKFDSAGVADPYVNGLTYSVGDVVTYNGQRYKCITAVVAAEPFDADKWSAEDVETVLNEIKSDLAELDEKVVTTISTSETYGTVLNRLKNLVDISKISHRAVLKIGYDYFALRYLTANEVQFVNAFYLSNVSVSRVLLSNNPVYIKDGVDVTSNTVDSAGDGNVTLYYD